MIMKTTAKWISENHYVLNNSKYLNIAVSDPLSREDNYELNCLDLVLMGFAGCVTAELKKILFRQSIVVKELTTDVEIEKLKMQHPNFALHTEFHIKSNAKPEILEECVSQAINSSMLGILFKEAGVVIHRKVHVTTPSQYAEMFTG